MERSARRLQGRQSLAAVRSGLPTLPTAGALRYETRRNRDTSVKGSPVFSNPRNSWNLAFSYLDLKGDRILGRGGVKSRARARAPRGAARGNLSRGEGAGRRAARAGASRGAPAVIVIAVREVTARPGGMGRVGRGGPALGRGRGSRGRGERPHDCGCAAQAGSALPLDGVNGPVRRPQCLCLPDSEPRDCPRGPARPSRNRRPAGNDRLNSWGRVAVEAL